MDDYPSKSTNEEKCDDIDANVVSESKSSATPEPTANSTSEAKGRISAASNNNECNSKMSESQITATKFPTMPKHSKNNNKAILILTPPSTNVETICDDISATTEDIKRLKHVQGRSNSTGKLYQSSRRVSFPENDSELVTGYLEPADPWACVKPATCVSELAEFYRESCERHDAKPIDSIMKHLNTLDINSNSRRPVLNLREQNLTAESCEALEEVLKRVQYKLIDLTDCGLTDTSATALFDMIEYYEAANEIDISENRNITNRGWQACINMVKRSRALQILVTRGTPLSESNAISLGKSMLGSSLATLKLEHCGLSGRPMTSLCTYLKKNTVLKELWLAHNDLTIDDAYNFSMVLKYNYFLQFLDLSNNNIQDRGVAHITESLVDQSNYFKVMHGTNECRTTHHQPLSSKHTLTRGNKLDVNARMDKESKYEYLARLINATKTGTETAGNTAKIEQTQDDEDMSIATSNSTNSLDLSEKNGSGNSNGKINSDNNNEVSKPNSVEKCIENMSNNEQIKESIIIDQQEQQQEQQHQQQHQQQQQQEQQQQQQQITTITKSNDDTIEKTDDIESATILFSDCHLDINENKPDMKLKYAEVVKVENAMEQQLCENKNFNGDERDDEGSDNVDNKQMDGLKNDLEDKVQKMNKIASDTVKRKIGCSSPKPIQGINVNRNDEPDEEMSPICKVRLPLNSPRLTKAKDIMNELPLTPDSSHSLDSSCEFSNSPFEIKQYTTAIVAERSFSSESLNSETSIESNDSKSSIKLAEAKFSKNGTLERQNNIVTTTIPPISSPNGLQVLMLWNNHLTREVAPHISDLLAATTTLEVLNVGKNVLSNDFVANIKISLKTNTSLTSLGLQGTHLSNDGVKTLSEILDFGGNTTLQRVDLRDNNLQVSGLASLNEVLKSNKYITRIDLDDVPRRGYEHSSDSSIDYNRVVNNIRSLCARNENPPDPEPIRTSVKRVRSNILNSRKISLTCQSIRNNVHDSPQAKAERHLLDPTHKSGRLRSPSPSPIPSPVSSPIPSPSRSRFQVSRVVENNSNVSPITPPSSNSCSPTSFTSSRFRVTVVEPPKIMSAPVTIVNSTNKELCEKLSDKTMIDSLKTIKRDDDHWTNSTSTSASTQTKDESHPSVTAMESITNTITSNNNNKKPTEQQLKQPITTTLTVIDNSSNDKFNMTNFSISVGSNVEDSCSSFSSLDSIDRGQDNTSFSSMDSLSGNCSGKKLPNPIQNQTVTKNLSNSSIESDDLIDLNNEAETNTSSSLEVSSNDSIYGSQEFPVLSNEGTLTNSPVSPCCGDRDDFSSKSDDRQQRVRKTSWISRGDTVPATLDKLLSIFHHPGNLFFPRSNNGDAIKKEMTSAQQQLYSTQIQTSPQPNQSNQQCDNKPPSRKESPMGGLFAWSKKENVFDELGADSNKLSPQDGGANQKLNKSPLQSNMSPENTLATDTVNLESIPIQLKQDVKENTSPEHTVTADSMANLQAKLLSATSAANVAISSDRGDDMPTEKEEIVEKVHFEVGGDEDDDDDNSCGESKLYTSDLHQHNRTNPNEQMNYITCNTSGKTLGQITRDSLSILKLRNSNNSQDSMQSLDSLSEVDVAIEK